jgi:subtilisin family serine protease
MFSLGSLTHRRHRWPLFTLLAALLAPLPAMAGSFDPDLASMPDRFPKKVKEAREDEILVKFKASVTAAARDDKHRREGHRKLRELRGSGVHHVRISPSVTVEEAIARYRADSNVEYAEPNHVLTAMRLPSESTGFGLLWGLQNTGQTLGTPGADIKAPLAWDLGTGSANVAVMVIDSGVDYTHPDLAANIFVNPGEIAGNGIDDDGNGYVDDVNGIDVVNGDTNPMDDYGHGTHVAGTIGAVGNNGIGVVGVNWNVRIIPCKILDATGNGTVADAVTCLNYARELKARGVNIVATNNSYGGLGSFSQTLYDAINAQRDILFVAAAGNFGTDNDGQGFYPANFDLPNVLSVAATDHNDLLPAFSNFGRRSVHLAAPGANITSTVPGNNYLSANGTSMAAPHVAGVAALLKAQDPTRDWRTIRNLILAGGDARPSLAGKSVSGRRLSAYGAATCSNRTLFSVLTLPASFAVGVPATVSALSINCGSAVGPVNATTSAGQSFTLRDDGVAPDLAAGDGIFSASFTPTLAFTSISFSSPAGTEQVGMPDLAVIGVTGPASANRGDAVTLDVTVANPSSMAAPASSLRLYLSIDGVITTTDILLGSVATPALAAGEQTVVSASVTIPTSIASAPYFLGAIVDPDDIIDEGDELNNAKAGSTITVGSLAIDLSPTALSGPATAYTGETISVSAVVSNLGSATAGASTLNIYLSTDPVITSADTFIGTAAFGALPGGAAQTATGVLPIPVNLAPGTYYLGAIADADNVLIETNETNNTRVGNTITINTRPVDLAVTAVGGPSAIVDLQPMTLTATVKNIGSDTAPASTLRWVLSSGSVGGAADITLASVATPSLKGGAWVKLSTTVSVPAGVPAGSYTLGAIVDPDNGIAETSKANNALAGGSLALSYSVDLEMTAVAGPSSGATGQTLSFTGTVKNKGLAASNSVTVGFYASADSSITSGDTLIGTATVGPIAAGASLPVTLTAALPTTLTAGSYIVGAIADPGGLVAESNESNNSRAGNSIDVSYGPDLVISAVSGPGTALRGQAINLSVTVLNQGIGAVGAMAAGTDLSATASAVRVGLYLSSNSTITTKDLLLVALPTTAIGPGQAITLTVDATLPASVKTGTYWIGAVADYSNGVREADEVNNTLAGNPVSVR